VFIILTASNLRIDGKRFKVKNNFPAHFPFPFAFPFSFSRHKIDFEIETKAKKTHAEGKWQVRLMDSDSLARPPRP